MYEFGTIIVQVASKMDHTTPLVFLYAYEEEAEDLRRRSVARKFIPFDISTGKSLTQFS